MSANTNRPAKSRDSSPPSEVELFAHAVFGTPLRSARAEQELLEFAAAISAQHSGQLLRARQPQGPIAAGASPRSEVQQFAEALLGHPVSDVEHRQELLEFVAAITTMHEADWDAAKHPRGSYPQNRGWFSPADGTSGEAGGAASTLTGAMDSDPKRVHATLVSTPKAGHHYAPVGAVFNEDIRPLLSDEAAQYAAGATSGQTDPRHGGGTYGEVTHPAFNAEVKKELQTFIKMNKITKSNKMTAAQMEEFVGLLKKGLGADGEANPVIGPFNSDVQGMVPKGTKAPTTMEEILAAGRKYMKNPRFQTLAAVAVISGVLGEIVNQQTKLLEVTANSRHYQAALRALERGDVASAHGQLTGVRDSLATEIVEKVGAHAGLNFRTAMDKAFTNASKKEYK